MFSFLENEEVQIHFADLNIDLLRGRHIQRDDYYSFELLDKYEDDLRYYYTSLYGLVLTKEKVGTEIYYYLDFSQDGRGKLSSPSRYKQLSDTQVIIGIMLLNMYYDRFFNHLKEIDKEDIKKEILEGENSHLYKKLLFDDIRDDYSDLEWNKVIVWLKKTLKDFDTLGWIQRQQSLDLDEIRFTIKESIHRLAKLYKNEIENFDQFVEEYNSRRNI